MAIKISGSTIIDDSRHLVSVGVITASSLDISGDIDIDGHTELDDVNIAGVLTATQIADSNSSVGSASSVLSSTGSGLSWVAQSGGGIALTDLSVGSEGTASGDGAISYNNSTGVFTYTPPDLSNIVATASSVSGISSVGAAITMYGSTGIVSATNFYGQLNDLTYPTTNGDDGYVLTSDGAGVVQWEAAPGAGGGIDGITIKDETTTLSTLATTLKFVGSGVEATGSGAEKTITISGGGGGGGVSEALAIAYAIAL